MNTQLNDTFAHRIYFVFECKRTGLYMYFSYVQCDSLLIEHAVVFKILWLASQIGLTCMLNIILIYTKLLEKGKIVIIIIII